MNNKPQAGDLFERHYNNYMCLYVLQFQNAYKPINVFKKVKFHERNYNNFGMFASICFEFLL